jgi:hypothetical protein
MICPGCGSESFGATFTGDGPRHKCNGCGNLFDPELMETLQPVEGVAVPPVPLKKAAHVLGQVVSGTPLTPTGIVKQARVELRALDLEIKRLEKLKKQRDELRRLIAAAKQPSPKRTATVHKLRANGE